MGNAVRIPNSRALKGLIALSPAAAARCSRNGSHFVLLLPVLSVLGLCPCVRTAPAGARLEERRGVIPLHSLSPWKAATEAGEP